MVLATLRCPILCLRTDFAYVAWRRAQRCQGVTTALQPIHSLLPPLPHHQHYHHNTTTTLQAPPALELGPSAVSAGRPPSLGDALEAGYAAARQAVRSSNGIRVLLMLLQVGTGGLAICFG